MRSFGSREVTAHIEPFVPHARQRIHGGQERVTAGTLDRRQGSELHQPRVLTDKANIEIEAPASGILAGVIAQPDNVIPLTEVIAHILEPVEDLPPRS